MSPEQQQELAAVLERIANALENLAEVAQAAEWRKTR